MLTHLLSQIGAAVFCLVHLVHSLLNCSKQVMYVIEGHEECYTIDREEAVTPLLPGQG